MMRSLLIYCYAWGLVVAAWLLALSQLFEEDTHPICTYATIALVLCILSTALVGEMYSCLSAREVD